MTDLDRCHAAPGCGAPQTDLFLDALGRSA